MRVAFSTTLLLIIFVTPSLSQDTYRFLRTDVSPRIAALGGAFVSMEGDPNSLFVNPGVLSTVGDQRFSVAYLDHLLDINAGSVALAFTQSPLGVLAAGIVFLHYGSFEQTDQAANQYGTFTASDLALSVGTAHVIGENLSVGGAVKVIVSSLGEYQSSAAALDLGAFYSIPSERIGIGIAVQHLGTQLSTYAGKRESLPTDVRLGITKRPEHLPVLLNLNFHGLSDPEYSLSERLKQFSAGAEFEMSSSFRLRIGLNNRVRRDLRLGTSAGLAGFSLGAGILISGTVIDYAFNSYGLVGGLHRIGLSAPF